MRVAGNQLSQMADFYYRELSGMYDRAEIEALLQQAVQKVLGIAPHQLRLKLQQNLNQSDLLILYDCAKELKTGKPLQYILGEAWFCDLPFRVSPAVLIPRPETEELVHYILRRHQQLNSLLDIGTGSGCIPVSVKKRRPDCRVSACDVSHEALAVARSNAEDHQAEIDFFQTDILRQGLPALYPPVEVIVSNPPYIKLSEKSNLHANVVNHEPHLALFTDGEDEIIFYRHIIALCKERLLPGGVLYFELNPLTADEVRMCAEKSAIFDKVAIIKDLSGHMRFMEAFRKK